MNIICTIVCRNIILSKDKKIGEDQFVGLVSLERYELLVNLGAKTDADDLAIIDEVYASHFEYP